MMKSKKIREIFFEFFKSKQHKIISSAPMVIKDDPSLMFTNAGMNQFKDIFLDARKPQHKRIANTQKCLRVSGKHNDIEDVGHDTYHHTMFEMLGNWSFGDYFKEEAIEWAWELLTDVYKIDKDRLYITVFGGDKIENLDIDNEAENIWKKYIAADRILYGSKKDNFWEMGDVGPCGPCSEIHVDIRDDKDRKAKDGKDLVNMDHPEVIEIWNLVFIQYNRKADSSLEQLPSQHVDTGMGFERLCMVLQNKKSNYDTDIFTKLINEISLICGIKYNKSNKTDIAMRVIADHLRAVSFSIADGQLPSNVKAGYVIRRILRRAVRYGYSFLDLNEAFMYKLVPVLIEIMGDSFTELKYQQKLIESVIREEEKVFLRTLEKGMKLIEQKISELKESEKSVLSGKDSFTLYDTYGFPPDLTELIARENNISVEIDEFDNEMKKQKSRGRTDAEQTAEDWTILKENNDFEFVGYHSTEHPINITKYRKISQKGKNIYHLVFDVSPFYAEAGGQVGDTGYIISEKEKIRILNTITEHNTTIHIAEKLPENPNEQFVAKTDKQKRKDTERNHSATHLMHHALRKTLGEHVEQKGSLVDENRLRFDFSHFNKLSAEELRKVEKIVNSLIMENKNIEEHRNIDLNEAKDMGAISLFGEKYGDTVRVIKFGDAIELCGGTHVKATGDIGFFKVINEGAIAAGIRRIEAVTGEKAEDLIFSQFDKLDEIREILNKPKDIVKTVSEILEENSKLSKKIDNYNKAELQNLTKQLIDKAENIKGISLISGIVKVSNAGDLKDISALIRGSLNSFVCILGAVINNKPNLIIAASENLVNDKDIHAGNLIREASKHMKGGGGGQAFVATAGGSDSSGLPNALEFAIEKIKTYLA
jgi:alanyl-tRNA synthetase